MRSTHATRCLPMPRISLLSPNSDLIKTKNIPRSVQFGFRLQTQSSSIIEIVVSYGRLMCIHHLFYFYVPCFRRLPIVPAYRTVEPVRICVEPSATYSYHTRWLSAVYLCSEYFSGPGNRRIFQVSGMSSVCNVRQFLFGTFDFG